VAISCFRRIAGGGNLRDFYAIAFRGTIRSHATFGSGRRGVSLDEQIRARRHVVSTCWNDLALTCVGGTERRERLWTSAGETPARELVRSTR